MVRTTEPGNEDSRTTLRLGSMQSKLKRQLRWVSWGSLRGGGLSVDLACVTAGGRSLPGEARQPAMRNGKPSRDNCKMRDLVSAVWGEE